MGTSKKKGTQAEAQALAYLEQHGLKLVRRHYELAQGPSHRAGEIDLVMRERDGTLVFVEVRAKSSAVHGGAAASISLAKQRRVIYAAQCFLRAWASPPACRFDVVAVDGGQLAWLKAAFEPR